MVKKELQVKCQHQNLTPCQVSDNTGHLSTKNLEIYQSKPALLTVQRFELNWFLLVLHADTNLCS